MNFKHNVEENYMQHQDKKQDIEKKEKEIKNALICNQLETLNQRMIVLFTHLFSGSTYPC